MVEGFRLHRYSDANLLGGPICFFRGKAPPTWQTERLYIVIARVADQFGRYFARVLQPST